MQRRYFIYSAAALGSAAALAGMWQMVQRPKPQPPADPALSPLATLIQKKLPTLRLPVDTLEAFVKDHESKRGSFKGKKVSRDLVQSFLLSTDFVPEANESRPLAYVTYYDPRTMPCRNPLRG